MNNLRIGHRLELSTLLGLLVAAAGTLWLVVGCSSSPPAPTDAPKQEATPTAAPKQDAAVPKQEATPTTAVLSTVNAFVGNAACEECHSDIVKSHALGRHANTLRPMDRESLGKMAPPEGLIPNLVYTIATQGDQFGLSTQQQPNIISPLQLAFGSGKTGMTYVAVLSPYQLAEMRMSYFSHTGQWYITPGQEKLKDQRMGKIHSVGFSRRCVLCHAVTVPQNTLMPEKRFMGVGCEACHGQGGMHVAAMRAGKMDALHMEPLKKAGGKRINQICGACHVTTQKVIEMQLPKDDTQRFQTYGLEQSKCFTQSNDKLTCITCHNPHTDVSRDTQKYESICLSCHATSPSGAKSTSASHHPSVHVGKICPVNSKSGCISCHMPSRKLFVGTDIPTMMSDHFIRVYGKAARKEH